MMLAVLNTEGKFPVLSDSRHRIYRGSDSESENFLSSWAGKRSGPADAVRGISSVASLTSLRLIGLSLRY